MNARNTDAETSHGEVEARSENAETVDNRAIELDQPAARLSGEEIIKSAVALETLLFNEVEASLPDYIRSLKGKGWGIYQDIVCLWMEVEQLTAGTKANRLQLGQRFRKLRDIYSDRNIGGNRRTPGHGTFERECLQRGYKPRTVRDLIADYEACIAGKPSAAEKRKERQARKKHTTPLHSLRHMERAVLDLVENPRGFESLSPEKLESWEAEAKKAMASIQAFLSAIWQAKIRFAPKCEDVKVLPERVQ